MSSVVSLRPPSLSREQVRRALSGDPAAARRVHAELVPLVGRFVGLLRAGRPTPPEVVADIVAEVMLSLGSFRGAAGLPTWVYSVTFRQLAEWERLEARRRRLEESWALETARPVRWPDDVVFDRQRYEAVLDIVSGLAIRPRTCFLLAVLADMSAADIAKVVGGTVRSVRDSATYVRARVRDELRHRSLLDGEKKPRPGSEAGHERR